LAATQTGLVHHDRVLRQSEVAARLVESCNRDPETNTLRLVSIVAPPLGRVAGKGESTAEDWEPEWAMPQFGLLSRPGLKMM
jgi:hypothetical protein